MKYLFYPFAFIVISILTLAVLLWETFWFCFGATAWGFIKSFEDMGDFFDDILDTISPSRRLWGAPSRTPPNEEFVRKLRESNYKGPTCEKPPLPTPIYNERTTN